MTARRTAGAVLAALIALLLGACSDDSPSSTGGHSPPPSDASSSATSSATSSSGPSPTDDASDYTILDTTSRADLEPGRWAVTAAGKHGAPLAVLELPEGLNGGGEFIWTVGGAPENDGWTFGYYTVGGIYPDPCTRASGTFDHEGSTFPDIWVEALEAQRRTTTSGAVPVTLGGYDGIYVELTGPKGLDYGTCREDRLTIFETTAKGQDHWIAQSGVVDRFWILDVDGERIVLTGQVTPETTDSQFEQLTEIVESVQFERSSRRPSESPGPS